MHLVATGPSFMPCVIQKLKVNSRKISSRIETYALKHFLEIRGIGIKRTAVEVTVFNENLQQLNQL